MILDIMKYQSPCLRQKCLPVPKGEPGIEKLAKNMAETLYAAPGVGLAAPQVGVLKRIAVIDISKNPDQRNLMVLINPEINCSLEQVVGEEGCLSIPDVYGDVKRSRTVKARFFDLNWQEHEIVAEDLLARVIQHEVDHLDGILFIDRMSKIKRDLIKMKLRKKSRSTVQV